MLKQTLWKAATLAFAIALAPAAVHAADDAPKPVVEQGALDLLKKMSDTLTAAKALELSITDFREVPTSQGQMITLVTSADIVAERPNRFRADGVVNGAATSFVYDGKTFTALDKDKNLYVQGAVAADQLEAFFSKLAEERGIQFSVADFLSGDPYGVLTKGVVNAYDLGEAVVEGTRTQHLVFSAKGIEWQVWIDPKTNLPRLFAATYTDVPREPRFLVNFKSWNLDAKPAADSFTFTPPKDATAIEFLPQGKS